MNNITRIAKRNPNVTIAASCGAMDATVARPIVRLTATAQSIADWDREAEEDWNRVISNALFVATGDWMDTPRVRDSLLSGAAMHRNVSRTALTED